jgi:uncharacterized protein involved in exopolysaccharide biosynthesis
MSMTDENSSSLFPVVLGSDLVADAVLGREYQFESDGESRRLSLSEYFGVEDRDQLRAALRGITSVSTDARTGELVVSVETEYPELSQAVLSEYIAQLESYHMFKRKSRAGENQRYLDQQLAEARDLLTEAEDRLEAYRKANANWAATSSPTILTYLGRYQREVELRSASYLLLQEQHELAKFEAQKDMPIVRILDRPSLPSQKSGPYRRNLIVLSALVSLGLAVLFVFIADLVRQSIAGANRGSFEVQSRSWTASDSGIGRAG